jgi:hypothetical protein
VLYVVQCWRLVLFGHWDAKQSALRQVVGRWRRQPVQQLVLE